MLVCSHHIHICSPLSLPSYIYSLVISLPSDALLSVCCHHIYTLLLVCCHIRYSPVSLPSDPISTCSTARLTLPLTDLSECKNKLTSQAHFAEPEPGNMSGQEVRRLHLPGGVCPILSNWQPRAFYPNPALETCLQVSHTATPASHFEAARGVSGNSRPCSGLPTS